MLLITLGIISLGVFIYLSITQKELSTFGLFLLAIGTSFAAVGIFRVWQFSSEFLRVMDFVYYGLGMFGVIFFFESQSLERQVSAAHVELASIEMDLELTLARASNLEQMQKNPDAIVEASVRGIFELLYKEYEEIFARWCEQARNQRFSRGIGPPDPQWVCDQRDEYLEIRDGHLSAFNSKVNVKSEGPVDRIRIEDAALRDPSLFFEVVSVIKQDISKAAWIPWPGIGTAAVEDLGLALSAQRNGYEFETAFTRVQSDIKALNDKKEELETAEQRGRMQSRRDTFRALVLWMRYNIWPIFLILAFSIKLGKTAHG